MYRPHSGAIENFTLSLETILENQTIIGADCMVGGDFNIDISSQEGGPDCFLDMMHSHHLFQTIAGITRPSINNSTGSLLDHICINNISNYNSGIMGVLTCEGI